MAESEKQLRRKIQELTALYEISRAMASNLDLKDTATAILDILTEKLDMRRGTLTLLDATTGHLAIAAAHGLTGAEIERGKYKIGEGITGQVVEKGKPMIVPDIGKEPLFLDRTRSRGDIKRQNIAFICVPIQAKGETLGVLSVDRLFKDDISLEEDVRLLTVVASLVGQNVMLHRLFDAEKQSILDEKKVLETELKGKFRLENVVGESGAMRDVYKFVRKVAPTRSTVIIRGESGTGKELIARAIHYASPRADGPFIKVSCAALPETLLESELFGHEKGSYTGATEAVKGRFELADGGTLFLDEIGDITPSTQVKLLRVLQERKFERVGGTKTLTADVRILTATNRNLEQAIAFGRFREDLYYRLNVVPVFLPSLRERPEDIPLLVDHFLFKYNKENGTNYRIDHKALERLTRHPWPGNVRELENTIERMTVMAKGEMLSESDVPPFLGLMVPQWPDPAVRSAPPLVGPSGSVYSREAVTAPTPPGSTPDGTLAEIERRRVLEAMEKCGWVQARACKMLGITPRQLGYKLKKYKIEFKPTIS